jgi:hypothetical protein
MVVMVMAAMTIMVVMVMAAMTIMVVPAALL